MLMTFGEAFAAMLHKRKLSVSSAAAELGFTSKTALFRIVKDESRPQSIRNCLELAKKSDKLRLSQEEIKELEQALRVSTIGMDAYRMSRVFHQLLHPQTPDASTSMKDIRLEGCQQGNTFRELLDFYRPLSHIRITIYGKCERAVLEQIHLFAQQADVQRIWQVSVIDERSPEDVGVLATATDILFSPKYKLSIVRTEENCDSNWIFRSGMILMSAELSGKKRCAHQLAPIVGGSFYVLRNDKGLFQRFWKRMMENVKDRVYFIKREPSDIGALPFPHNYIRFIEEYCRIEHGREIYMVKQDIPLCCIPTQIIRKPIEECFQAFGLGENAERLINRMQDIHEERFANIYEKAKPTHIILNREAMERFARMGRTSDHLFLLRPFTPMERVKILQMLLFYTRKNRRFHIWFVKKDALMSDREITCYEGEGIAIVRSDTSWNLERDHQEVFFESKVVSYYLKQYVLNEVLVEQVLPEEESCAILEELIDIAKMAQ